MKITQKYEKKWRTKCEKRMAQKKNCKNKMRILLRQMAKGY